MEALLGSPGLQIMPVLFAGASSLFDRTQSIQEEEGEGEDHQTSLGQLPAAGSLSPTGKRARQEEEALLVLQLQVISGPAADRLLVTEQGVQQVSTTLSSVLLEARWQWSNIEKHTPIKVTMQVSPPYRAMIAAERPATPPPPPPSPPLQRLGARQDLTCGS